MPSNAVGVRWYPAGGDPEAVVLRDVETDLVLEHLSEPYAGGFDLFPAQPVEPGKVYRFEFPAAECNGPTMLELTAGPAAALEATSLGTLVAGAPTFESVEVPESVVCSDFLDAVSVRVELTRDPLLEPFADLLMYETLVDGERWGHAPRFFAPLQVGRSWVGRGVDVVFATCPGGGSDGVALGTHQVQMRAEIPGLPGVVLESDVVEIVLECAGGTETETGETDNPDSSDDGSFVVPIDRPDPAAGCACRSQDGRRSGTVAFLVLLSAWGHRARRRRRSITA